MLRELQFIADIVNGLPSKIISKLFAINENRDAEKTENTRITSTGTGIHLVGGQANCKPPPPHSIPI
jgi:hypothetical protein